MVVAIQNDGKKEPNSILLDYHIQTSALGVIQRRLPVIIALTDTANLKPGFKVRVAADFTFYITSRHNKFFYHRN